MPIENQGAIRFDLISPDDMRLIWQCADRAYQYVADYKRRNQREAMLDPDKHLIAMDFATVHLARPLSLYQLLMSNDLDFVADFVAITKHLDRSCGRIPDTVYLRFQQAK